SDLCGPPAGLGGHGDIPQRSRERVEVKEAFGCMQILQLPAELVVRQHRDQQLGRRAPLLEELPEPVLNLAKLGRMADPCEDVGVQHQLELHAASIVMRAMSSGSKVGSSE